MSSWIGREQREREQIINFVALTGAQENEARHHLEQSGWNASVALAQYQNVDISNRPEVRPTLSAVRSETESPAFMPRSNPAFATVEVDDPPTRKRVSQTEKKARASKLMTLADLDSFSDEDEAHEPLAKSESFATRGQNASFLEADKGHVISFSGAGYTLSNPTKLQEESEISVVVTFWKKGYSVDNGELRRMSEKKHRDFLRSLNEGILPLELSCRVNSNSRSKFKIHLVDRKTETYVPSTPEGRLLSSTSPSTSELNKNNRTAAVIPIDETQPTTQILIRLPSGETSTVVMNTHHRLKDLFALIESRYPAPEGNSFVLRLTYPRRVFKRSQDKEAEGASHVSNNQDENALSLEELGLLSCCLVQEFTLL